MLGFLYMSSFSPINFKFGMFISLFIYLYILLRSSVRSSIFKSYIYGISIFTFGVSWIFNSIYYYGGQHLLFSTLMTVIFILLMSIFFIPIGFFINKKKVIPNIYYPAIAASIWVCMEFLRSTLFGGFPWLLAGTSQVGTFLNYLYPLLGVYFVSFMIVLIIMMILIIFLSDTKKYILTIYSFILIFIFSVTIIIPSFLTDSKEPLRMTIIQPNIHLGIKFDDKQLATIKDKYIQAMDNNIHELVILPETAIPKIYQFDKSFYEAFKQDYNVNLITGIFNFNREDNKIYNSLLMLNNDNENFYNKRHLVPFGEYTPLKNVFSFLAEIIDIPMSNISHGQLNQNKLIYKNVLIHPLICYEIAYPSLIETSNDYGIIINLSNDAWFGDSFAPYQHLQIAQTRALESGRPVIRVANTGISAVVDKNGVIISKIALNEEGYINTNIYPSRGITPYMYFGDYPLLMLIFTIILLYLNYYRKYG